MVPGLIGNLVLVFLPGAWVTFGLPSRGVPFWAKLLIGVMLAPFIVGLQFYACRLLGISFEITSILLVFLNLPALYLVWKHRVGWPKLSPRMVLAGLIVFAAILISIAPFLLDPQKRLYTWEAWTQADVVYSIANGELLPEDAELVGVRLSYPWTGHIYQGVLSYLDNTPPATDYIWSNLIWLLGIFTFSAAIVAALGGGPLACGTVAIWLSFGVNFVGQLMSQVVPTSFIRAHPIIGNIWGDNRYTPWLDKIVFFGQMYFAMGLFIALLYLMVKRWPGGFTAYHYVVTFLLLAALGIIYVLLLPPACGLVAAKALTLLFDRSEAKQHRLRQVLILATLGLVAVGLSYAVFRLTTQDRTGEATLTVNGLEAMVHQAAEGIVVTSPLLVGLALLMRRLWKAERGALVILVLGSLTSLGLYTAVDIPWYRNEYKYIFTAAICLAPFSSIAAELLMNRLGRMALPAVAAITLVFAAPFAYNVYTKADTTAYTLPGPLADLSNFNLRLDPRERLANVYDAIRERTPIDTILVLDQSDLHVPTLTRRQLYAPPAQKAPFPGVLVTSDETLTQAKGYDATILADRRAILEALFHGKDAAERAQALDRILEFDRPVAIILDTQDDVSLFQWLSGAREGAAMYTADGVTVWLIDSDPLHSTALLPPAK